MSFSPLDWLLAGAGQTLFWTPERLGTPSDWWGHVPFAFWAVAAARPRLIVEIGTASGVSYAAFCEAVCRLQAPTICRVAIVDEAQSAATEAFAELKAFNKSKYAAFSEVSASEDAALRAVADGAVDLLHIDGAQGAEDVRAIFDRWRPKLSDRGIVLLHDTNTPDDGAGVGRFFRELARDYASFEFLHAGGLGVLCAGPRAPDAIRALCALTDEMERATVRERFAFFGARWEKVVGEHQPLARRIREVEASFKNVIIEKDAKISGYIGHLERINSSPWWRLGMQIDRIARAPFAFLASLRPSPAGADDESYARWIELYDRLDPGDRASIEAHIARFAAPVLVSVALRACGASPEHLRRTLASIGGQLYPHWELCVAIGEDDAGAIEELSRFAATEPRLKIVRVASSMGCAAAGNRALDLCSGDFVLLLDQHEVLDETALYEFVAELQRSPEALAVYSDEDCISPDGERRWPRFKTDWDPEAFLAQNILGGCVLYRRSLLQDVGGYHPDAVDAEDYDLALRALYDAPREKIRHVPAILHHLGVEAQRRSAAEAARLAAAARSAKRRFFEARGSAAAVVESPLLANFDRVLWPVPTPAPLVSLIVPTKNRADLLGPCLEGLLLRTDYPNFEVIVIDHESDEPATLSLLSQLEMQRLIRIMSYRGRFNYSKMNNAAVTQARGALVGFVNNDVDVIDSGWLREMVSYALRSDIGAVGAKLLYEDDRLQHGGIITGIGGSAGHTHLMAGRDDAGYLGRLATAATTSAVTAACLVVRTSVFEEAGGFNEVDLPQTFNDIDLCLKIEGLGFRNVWTPFALLYHKESASRGKGAAWAKQEQAEQEAAYMKRKWGLRLLEDPYYNPNLSLDSHAFELAFPPRRIRPWKLA